MSTEAVSACKVEKLKADQFKPFDHDHACVVGVTGCPRGQLYQLDHARRGYVCQRSEKLKADQFKSLEQVILEPFECEHACIVGGYRMPKK